ncbi:hypothetical protein [Clostridium tertium]|uniref:hypothetical protein n=1 Tax=Clostridium tertium TaxID=1559 RepID=UPI0024B35875|nr:hypothetical protein [Clostridium tertium]MDI9216012.1 hypothetical protein [Clostridium tertium]
MHKEILVNNYFLLIINERYKNMLTEIELKILKDIEFGYNVINDYFVYKFKNQDELENKLVQLKKEGLVDFKECQHPVFLGKVEGKMCLTRKGKEVLNSK